MSRNNLEKTIDYVQHTEYNITITK